MILIFKPQRLTVNNREILRYLGVKSDDLDKKTLESIALVQEECASVIRPAVCYTEADVLDDGKYLNVANISTDSRDLRKNLQSCRRSVLFCATVGVGIDRLLAKYGRLNSFQCTVVQAVGSAYAEALCNEFCAFLREQKKPLKLRPRFSPGYGDFPLEEQKHFFALLSPEKWVGVTLNGSLLMSPSKSVTAIVGISEEGCEQSRECDNCNKTDCPFRR